MKHIENLFIATVVLTLASCVSQSEYDKLKRDKTYCEETLEQTKVELENVKSELSTLKYEKSLAKYKADRTPYITEVQAKKYLKDFYDFYERDTKYRNTKFRRINDNSFEISMEVCTKKASFSENDFFWSSIVRVLSVKSDGSYVIK